MIYVFFLEGINGGIIFPLHARSIVSTCKIIMSTCKILMLTCKQQIYLDDLIFILEND